MNPNLCSQLHIISDHKEQPHINSAVSHKHATPPADLGSKYRTVIDVSIHQFLDEQLSCFSTFLLVSGRGKQLLVRRLLIASCLPPQTAKRPPEGGLFNANSSEK